MQYLFEKAAGKVPLKTVVVHPVTPEAIKGVFNAVAAGYTDPILVGPEHKIRKAAADAGIDITNYEIVPTEHSHAAAAKAVELVAAGKAEALMKGSLHTSEFLKAILDEKSLRTEYRMSHVFLLQDHGYHKPLYLTDTAFNKAPDTTTKSHIVQNAIDLYWTVEGHAPKVAIVASTEEIDFKDPETTDAASLSQMSHRMQITGGEVDGPLGFDMAIAREAAQAKGMVTDITGDPDIIVFPNLSAGNIFFKSRIWMRPRNPDGTFTTPPPPMAGIVLGARVPIILTSRSASPDEYTASAALALINVRSPHRAP